MEFFTADLCDKYPDKTTILGPEFKSFAAIKKCKGKVVTVKLDKNNKDLAKLLKEQEGEGKVVVVDVDMQYYAVVGDNLMKFAYDNKYEGIVVNGYVRDSVTVKDFDVVLYAKGTCPRKYIPVQDAIIGCDLQIDNIVISDGVFIYIDSDGIVITKEELI